MVYTHHDAAGLDDRERLRPDVKFWVFGGGGADHLHNVDSRRDANRDLGADGPELYVGDLARKAVAGTQLHGILSDLVNVAILRPPGTTEVPTV